MATKQINSYKLRAECMADIIALLNTNKVGSFKMKRTAPFPDIHIKFESTSNLGSLHKLISKIEDGHTMSDTLKKI